MANFYEILGVSQNATPQEIRVAFKTLVNQLSDEDKLNDVSRAYSVLGNEERRHRYDERINGTSVMFPSFAKGFDGFGFMNRHLEIMKKEMEALNTAMKELEITDEKPVSNSYSKTFKTSSYIDDSGNRITKSVKEITKNGKTFKEFSVIDGATKTVKKYLPTGEVKETKTDVLEKEPDDKE